MEDELRMYFDSHAHLDDERVLCEYDGGTRGIIQDSMDAGVHGIVNVGTNIEGSESSIRLAGSYPFIYAAVGIYPSEACRDHNGKITACGMDLERATSRIREMLSADKVVALGEIGLDYHYDDTDREAQACLFDMQMKIASECGIPVIIHDREAHGDVFDTICRYENVHGVMHSFSGSAEMARQLVERGYYISFSGTVTYKNASKVKEAAAAVPLDRLLVETDTPYLPPVPHRGEVNRPGYISYTVRAIAELRGMSEESVARLTSENAMHFFGII